jgi:hypothetical protein
MGKENFEKLDDFIFSIKDKSIKKVFFKFIPKVQKVALQTPDGKEAEGLKHSVLSYLTAMSEDEKFYFIYESQLCEQIQNPTTKNIELRPIELIQTPITTEKEIGEFQQRVANSSRITVLEPIQKDYSNADLKAGFISPLVN